MEKNGTHKTRVILLFLVGLALFISIFYLIGFDKLFNQLLKVYLPYYLISIAFIVLFVLLWALRWWLFVRKTDPRVPYFDILKNHVVGLAVNNLTPVAKLGGEPVKAYILKKKHHISIGEGLATVLSDLTLEYIVSVGVVIVAIFLYITYTNPPLWMLVIVLFFLLLAFLVLAGLMEIRSERDLIPKLIRWVSSRLKRIEAYTERILEGYKEFQQAFRRGLKDRKTFSAGLTLSILMKVAEITSYYFVFLSMGYEISPLILVIIMGVNSMFLSIPATPGSLGVVEGGLISTFILLGVPSAEASAAVFLQRIPQFWGVIVIGSLLGVHYGVSFWSKTGTERKEMGMGGQ
ncbi:MAG: lysylphosphatidylglycerol synthase transmembrane domain-containing protein [Archaeoglobaceae archaeon]